MKRLLFSVILGVVLPACSETTGEQKELFLIPEMNEALREFVEASESDCPGHCYQIVIGGNRLGAKVSLIECVNGPLYGCLYWLDYHEPKYVGYYILGRDSIGVYAAPDEIVQTIIDELALNKQVLQMADSDIDNTRIRGKYYQITDRTVKELPENQIDMKRMTYHYVGSNQDTTSHELIMASNPPYYEMLFSNIVVFGTWDYASQHLIHLQPFKVLQYSMARNDLVEISLDEGKDVSWDGFEECLHVSQYNVLDGRLYPVNSPEDTSFYWMPEK